ncbi:sporulation protein YpjB [Tenuibacillus multivorans]|uniref:Sporulation protein YpjB (SpoYpjB) n=1 Tax=Tenuibacillus multivorans TaxID=237069 RepID=A0A1H0CTP1_9BACI|nr:sporulation protein YpjB [Tenuibacillus multivorans]GEL76167.1 hypothetical protein TMU01_04020 [Tenuibacillus multivorans]SDN61246.1 Sporulation protein YpjB (SpoYpjB) [Tenuibacillus multivorans]
MDVTLDRYLQLATHSSISEFLLTVLIIFGSVLLTLIYVGWQKYSENNRESNKIDEDDTDD